MALSITQDGPGMYFLNQKLYELMNGEQKDLRDLEIETIPDTAARDVLQKVSTV